MSTAGTRAPRLAVHPTGRCLALVADVPTFGAELEARLAAALAAVPGRTFVIARDPSPAASTRERLAHLARLAAIARALEVPLIVSGRVDLALAAGLDAVHLPEAGLAADVVRAAWPTLVVGRSCHDRAGLVAAEAHGATYALLSPVARPTSKPLAEGVPLGIEGFARAVRGLALPVLALGGIGPALARPLREAGAAGLACLGAVLGAADPANAANELVRAWDAGPS